MKLVADDLSRPGLDALDAAGRSAAEVSGAAPEPAQVASSGSARVDRRRVAVNVGSNWLAHLVFVAGGFVVPRLISDRIGAVRLGIWDFGWSFVGYVGLLTAGITSSTNRYVARHRATGDWAGLNRAASACLLIFMATALVAIGVTAATVPLLPRMLESKLAGHLIEARWVVLLLGLTAAVQMPLSVFNGVITGFQRYDWANAVEVGCHLLLLAGVFAALLMGAGLTTLAVMVLATELLAGGLKCVLARRVCPHLRLTPAGANWSAIRDVTVFGWKMFLERGARIFLYQTSHMLVMGFLGPAALATYARCSSLVQHATKLMFQFGRVFTPIASEMQARQDAAGIGRLMIEVTRQSMLFTIPVVAVFVFLGGPILDVWMGPAFAAPWVLGILAVGHLGVMGQSATYHILMGLDRHGRIGVVSVIAAAAAAGLCGALLAWTDLGLVGPALAVGAVLGAVNCIVLPWIAAREAGLSAWRFFLDTTPGPLLAATPLIAWLAAVRLAWSGGPYGELAVGLGVGAMILAATYWRFALTPSQRAAIGQRLTSRLLRGE